MGDFDEAAKGLKLFIGGLDYGTTDSELEEYFSKYGELTDHVVMKVGGRSRGFGFVTYAEPYSVEEVLKDQPHTLGNRNVETMRAKPKGSTGERSSRYAREDDRHADEEERLYASTKGLKLFVGGLDYSTTDAELYAYFEKYGEITDHVVMKDGGRSKGFGYVTFAETSAIDQILNDRPHRIGKRNCDTKRAVPKSQSGGPGSNDTKLFVGGLKEDINEEDLLQVFGIFGEVKNISIPLDKDKVKGRGFAFVEFRDQEVSDKVANIGELMVKGRTADIKKALTRDFIARSRAQGQGGGNMGSRMGGNSSFGGSNMGGNSNWGGSNMGNMGGSNMGNNMGGGGSNNWPFPFPQEMAKMFGAYFSQMSNMGMMGNMGGFGGNNQNNGGDWDGNRGGNNEDGNMGSNWMNGSNYDQGSSGGRTDSKAVNFGGDYGDSSSGPLRNSNSSFRGDRKPYGGRR